LFYFGRNISHKQVENLFKQYAAKYFNQQTQPNKLITTYSKSRYTNF